MNIASWIELLKENFSMIFLINWDAPTEHIK